MRAVIRLRRDHIVFLRRRFFHARFIPGTEIQDITWLRPDGGEMTEADWADAEARCLGFLIRGEAGQHHLTARGEPQPDDSFFVTLNAHFKLIDWTLPAMSAGNRWRLLFDTDSDNDLVGDQLHDDGAVYATAPRSFVIFVRHQDPQSESTGG